MLRADSIRSPIRPGDPVEWYLRIPVDSQALKAECNAEKLDYE